jgi:hypothetical protein
MITPMRGIVLAGWACTAHGTARRLRASVTMPPTVLYHMSVPLERSHAALPFSLEPNSYNPFVILVIPVVSFSLAALVSSTVALTPQRSSGSRPREDLIRPDM